jgi:hypothetical protein
MKSFKKNTLPPSSKDKSQVLRASKAAQYNYGRYRNVVGVGAGIKFKGNHDSGTGLCIHFYVRKKIKKPLRQHKLPRFIYARTRDGAVNYSRKFRTDVIELKNLRFACKSGVEARVIGESGSMTLVFQNKTPQNNRYYLLTCSHVAGNVRQSPPINPEISSECCHSSDLFATTLVNSTHKGGIVNYDIALAELTPECSPQPDCQVVDSPITIKDFLSASDIHPGLRLDCAFARSNIHFATVSSYRTSLPLSLDHIEYQVNNLFIINQQPSAGDSGGLLYDGEHAVGILVAKAGEDAEGRTGWGLFQPLDEAVEHLQQIAPVPIVCFRN